MSIKDNRRYHRRYSLAVNNPLRRGILREVRDGYVTLEALESKMRIKNESLEWHLRFLEHYHCIEKDKAEGKEIYRLTKEGEIIDYLDRTRE